MLIKEETVKEAVGLLGCLNRSFHKYGNKKFMSCEGETLTYADMVEKGNRVASQLYDCGIRKGDRVGILLANSCNWYVFLYGILRLGAIVVPFDPLLGEGELTALIKKAGVRVVITVPKHRGVDFIQLFRSMMKENYDLKKIIVDGKIGSESGFIPYDDQSIKETTIPDFELVGKDTNVFLCTTGSTGVSKIVDLDGSFYENCIENYTSYLEYDKGGVRFFSAMPLYHAAGLGYGLCCMSAGGEIYYAKRFMPSKMLNLLESEHITTILSTPTIMRVLQSCENFQNIKLESLEKIVFTGEALDNELVETYIEQFGVQVLNILGSSENFIYLVWDSKLDSQYPVSYFRGINHLDVRIFKEKAECSLGQQGTIKIKNQIMKGYYNEPKLTGDVIHVEDGQRWFDSGDRGVLMEDGRISYLGRKKKVMKRGGNLVAFEEVEYAIGLNQHVLLSVVTCEKDEKFGEKLIAYVQLKSKEAVTKQELYQFLRKEIAAYKVPDEIFYIDEIPESSGKASVRRLQQMLKEGTLIMY